MENSYLFVYGTLRKNSGHQMSRWLAQHANYVGEAKIKGDMYQVSYYPALVQGDSWIEGDIYACSEEVWLILDDFEETTGAHPEYARCLTPILLDDGQWLEAWVYWYLRPTTHLVRLT
ncbi:MAG: gamma-glutamylcyclotransferase [Moraxellaceae bacterium]|nr:gamma-glutamylcyclotransferase [Moraxellaceae bacterium]